MAARGEPRLNEIATNGETFVQKAVIAATANEINLTVLDIGCNQGDWVAYLLDALPESRLSRERTQLHVFEPVPQTRDRLAVRLETTRGGEIVQVESTALSDTNGTTQMAVLSSTGGTNTLCFDEKLLSSSLGVIDVATCTLAEFCRDRGIGRVHLVKCDTEGHDLSVIAGAAPLLAESRVDVLQFEYNHRWVYNRSFLKDVFDLVAPYPYALARIRSSWIEVLDEWHPELERYFEANYLLVRRPVLNWFDARHGTFDQSNTFA